MAKRPKPVHQMTIAQFEAMFPDEDACCAYLVAVAGPMASFAPVAAGGTILSPRCPSTGSATRAPP